MHLAETALIKKYENDIGGSIVDVGGDVTHDDHWLPFLDNQIEGQLVGGDIVDRKIDQHLDERGLTPEAVDAWNQTVNEFRNGAVRYDIEQLLTEAQQQQARENIGITQTDFDAWNQTVEDFRNGAVRYDVQQNLTAAQQQQARENIDVQTTYAAARWNDNES